jgi:hypothetical protein
MSIFSQLLKNIMSVGATRLPGIKAAEIIQSVSESTGGSIINVYLIHQVKSFVKRFQECVATVFFQQNILEK